MKFPRCCISINGFVNAVCSRLGFFLLCKATCWQPRQECLRSEPCGERRAAVTCQPPSIAALLTWRHQSCSCLGLKPSPPSALVGHNRELSSPIIIKEYLPLREKTTVLIVPSCRIVVLCCRGTRYSIAVACGKKVHAFLSVMKGCPIAGLCGSY